MKQKFLFWMGIIAFFGAIIFILALVSTFRVVLAIPSIGCIFLVYWALAHLDDEPNMKHIKFRYEKSHVIYGNAEESINIVFDDNKVHLN